MEQDTIGKQNRDGAGGVGMDISGVGMDICGVGMVGVGAIVQTIGEKLLALVPILRPVQDLVICKKHSVDLLLFPTQLQF